MDGFYYKSEDGLCYLALIKSEPFLFDAIDYPLISQYRWSIAPQGYARTSEQGRTIPMHTLIMGRKPGYVVDHISGEVMDNRRENLRFCTYQQNSFNQRLSCSNTSGYKGVSLVKRSGKYEAYVYMSDKKHSFGSHPKAEDAARVRDYHATQMFGQFSRPNMLPKEGKAK